ncbi:hypothetical protein ACQKJC_07225 [Priestia koreensis]|uniref:hypothetical protein n=1 Tax=Priestia koreensis TaxID=284581 RepID=UPI002041C38E|nr:hypothetical protein [Priestia koreensis]MCM3005382.1 hypothetical protein [Priestia koreensis]
MPPKLIKMFIEAQSSASGTVQSSGKTNVNVKSYKYTATVVSVLSSQIPYTSFKDAQGNPVPSSGFPIPQDGYYNIYVNQLLAVNSNVNLTSFYVTIPTALLSLGIPIVVEIISFDQAQTTVNGSGSTLSIQTNVQK